MEILDFLKISERMRYTESMTRYVHKDSYECRDYETK